MTIFELTSELTKLARKAPFGGDTTVVLSVQGLEDATIKKVILQVDGDGGVVELIRGDY